MTEGERIVAAIVEGMESQGCAGDNLYVTPDGARQCRTCWTAREAA